ncbi:hypothetical protein BDV18DRAFT_158681 [Aspergillus unguis]
MKFTAIATIFAALVAGTTAVATPLAYEATEVPSWEIEVFPNETMILNGTIEEVRAQALAINPNWVDEGEEAAHEEFKRALGFGSDVEKRDGLLAKRLAKDFKADHIACQTPWKDVEYMEAMRRNVYLMGHKGAPKLGAGPGKCSRVSCAYDVGITWCNDNKKSITLKKWSQVADGAAAIMDKCEHQKFAAESRVGGQAFHVDNWNVIIRKEDC